jgi:hypothetical protein
MQSGNPVQNQSRRRNVLVSPFFAEKNITRKAFICSGQLSLRKNRPTFSPTHVFGQINTKSTLRKKVAKFFGPLLYFS